MDKFYYNCTPESSMHYGYLTTHGCLLTVADYKKELKDLESPYEKEDFIAEIYLNNGLWSGDTLDNFLNRVQRYACEHFKIKAP